MFDSKSDPEGPAASCGGADEKLRPATGAWAAIPALVAVLLTLPTGCGPGKAPESTAEITPPPEEPSREKLVMTFTMNCYPVGRDYSNRINYEDRPADWDPDLTGAQSDAIKLGHMEEAGIDVNAQTVFYGQSAPPVGGNTKRGLGRFGHMLDAAAKTRSMRIAPEIVAIRRANHYGLEDLADFFRHLIETYGDHPRWMRHDGRLVVFLWNPFDDGDGPAKDFGPDELEKVWEMIGDLRDKIYVINECYYLVARKTIGDAWDEAYIDRLLTVCDNIFWWYTWVHPEEKKLRTQILADSLERRGVRPLIASIRPGYYRKNIGILNPFRVSEKFREMFEAVTAVDLDWLHIYSWDDYSEGAMVEPTRRNAGFFTALIRHLGSEWKGLDDPLPAELWLGTPSVAFHGEDIHAEVISLGAGAGPARVALVLDDPDGKEIWRSPEVGADGGRGVRVFPFTIPTHEEAFRPAHVLVPRLVVQEAGSRREIRGLAPIRLMPHNPVNPHDRFTRLDLQRAPALAEFSSRPESDGRVTGTFRVGSPGDPFRRLEIRNFNDDPMPCTSPDVTPRESAGDQAFYLPFAHPLEAVSGEFTLDAAALRDARATHYLFVEYADGGTWSSPPLTRPPDDGPRVLARVLRPDPGDNLADRRTSVWTPVGWRTLAESDAVVADWDFRNLPEGTDGVTSRCGYAPTLHLGFGPNTRLYTGDASNIPPVQEEAGGTFLHFDGKNHVARLPHGVIPVGAFTLGMDARPHAANPPGTLFYSEQGPTELKILPGGILEWSRFGQSVTAPIPLGQWSTIRAGDDGDALFLQVGDNPPQRTPHPPHAFAMDRMAYSSFILIGGIIDTTARRSGIDFFKDGNAPVLSGFNGDLRRVTIRTDVPGPDGSSR